MRRSALVVSADSGQSGGLSGEVVSAQATPDQVRLVVDVAGVGEVDAVGASDHVPGSGRAGHAGTGSRSDGGYPVINSG